MLSQHLHLTKRIGLLLLVSLTSVVSYTQSKLSYLKEHRYDLRNADFHFPNTEAKIYGFGAYHGSAKAEQVEQTILFDLIKHANIGTYIIEADIAVGYYFNRYMKTRDTIQLYELVKQYGIRVPQDRSRETFDKWKSLYSFNLKLPKEQQITILGIDPLNSYYFALQLLEEMLPDRLKRLQSWQPIKEAITLDTTDFSVFYESYTKQLLRPFLAELDTLLPGSNLDTTSKSLLNNLVINLTNSLVYHDRDQLIAKNFLAAVEPYELHNRKPFIRYGFSHLEKAREGNYPYFFRHLIEGGHYQHHEIISIIGFYTKSEVLWETILDDQGNYLDHTIEAGYGISDYWREYFRGIRRLKRTALSDLTLFDLSQPNSPYHKKKPDLIHIRMLLNRSNGPAVRGQSTTDFFDYAVLIKNSWANQPLK